jgi:hypothetical protein
MNASRSRHGRAALAAAAILTTVLIGSPRVLGADWPRASSRMPAEGAFWLGALRGDQSSLPVERVLIVGPDGDVLDRAEGERTRVALPGRFVKWLAAADSRVSLIHNHPSGGSLSNDDISLLGHPGVTRVVAIAHSGSVYEARRGPAFDSRTFESSVYPDLLRLLNQAVRRESSWFPDRRAYVENFAHAMCLLLVKLGVIEYRVELDLSRQDSWTTNRWAFERAMAWVLRDLQSEPRRSLR